MLRLQARIRDYVAVMGLDLVVDEAEGYAFLKSRSQSAAAASDGLPRLIARRPLSFPVSLLLALLRKKLAEFDAAGADTRLCYLAMKLWILYGCSCPRAVMRPS